MYERLIDKAILRFAAMSCDPELATDDQPDGPAGWRSDLRTFHGTAAGAICGALEDLVQGASVERCAAWRDGVPLLQREAGELIAERAAAPEYGAVLEYLLPYDGRRPDVVVLAEGGGRCRRPN